MTFEEKLLILLELYDENQARLARALGITRQMLHYKVKNDKFNRKELNQIKNYLGLSTEEFLELVLD